MSTNPPWMVAQTGANFYDPVEVRRLTVVPVGSYAGDEMTVRPGVFPGGSAWLPTVTGTTTKTWTVKRGTGIVDGPSGSGTGFLVALPADESGTVTAEASNPRKDILIVEVTAATDGVGQARYISGTAAATPVEPTTPTGALKVAVLDVASIGSGGAVTVTDTRQYTVPRGAVLPAAAGMPTQRHPGMLAYGLNLDRLLVRNAADTVTYTIWQPQQKAAISLLGGWQEGSGSVRPTRYTLDPASGFVTFQGRLARMSSNTTWTGETWNAITGALPVAIRPSGLDAWACASTQGFLNVRYNSTTFTLEGSRIPDTTWVQGTDWIGLANISYYLGA